MVTLGKVHAPKPVNLPSQKRENNGLDPNVPIVPRGLPGAACWSGAGQDGQDRHPSPGQEPQQPPANAWVNRGPSPQPSGKPPPQQGHPPPHQQQHPSGPVAWGGAGLPDQRKRQHDRWAGDFPQLGNDVPPREGSAGRQSGQDSFGHGPDEISVRSRQHPEHPGAQPPPDYQRGTVGFNHTRDGPPSSGQGYDGPVGGQHDRRFAGYPHGSLSGGSGDYPGPYRGPPPPPPPPPTGHRTSLGPQGAPPPHVGAGPYSHQHLHYKDGLPPPGSRYHQGRGPPGPGWQPPTGRYGQSPNRGPPEGRWDHRGCAPPRSDSMPPMRAPPNCYANSQMPRSTDAPPPSQRKTSLPPGPILVDHGDHDW